MPDTFFIPELDVPFHFVRRPSPLPPDLRPVWRIFIILLMLRLCCRGGKSNLQRLSVLNWAVRSPENRSHFLEVVEGQRRPEDIIVRHDPAFSRALDFAIGEKLIERVPGSKFLLKERGQSAAEAILRMERCLDLEKDFFKRLRGRVSEAMIDRLLHFGR
jgi:hypothetical protein